MQKRWADRVEKAKCMLELHSDVSSRVNQRPIAAEQTGSERHLLGVNHLNGNILSMTNKSWNFHLKCSEQ